MTGSALGSTLSLSYRCNQGDDRPGSRRPLARYLNGEGIGPCVAGICRVLECGFVELSKHSVCRALHNARSRYDAFYPEREQAGSSGRDVEDARRIDTKSGQCSRYRTFRGVLRQRDGHQRRGREDSSQTNCLCYAHKKSLALFVYRESNSFSERHVDLDQISLGSKSDLEALAPADVDFRRDAGPATTLT